MRPRVKLNTKGASGGALVAGVGCLLFILAGYVAFAGLCFQYTLYSTFGKDVPWFVDGVAGMLLGQFAIPAAIVCWVASFAWKSPFFA